jgi:uncharacterized protein (TIGR01777 family)
MRFAVTGASGFIGRRLLAMLESTGHEVHALGRAPRKGLRPAVRFFVWDPAEGPPPPASFEGVDAVIHLAGEPIAQRWSGEAKRRIRSSRLDGTSRLVQGMVALPQKPSVLVSGSAIGFYGDRGDEVLTELSSPGTGFLPEVCLEWEKAAALAEEHGVRTVVVRTGVVLGRNGGALAKMLPPFRMGVGGPVSPGSQWMSWIHIDDMARLLLFAAETASLRGPVNAVSPKPVTNADFSRALGRALKRPAILPTPQFALRLLFGEMSEILTGSQRVQPRAAQTAGFEFRHTEVFAALKDLMEEK